MMTDEQLDHFVVESDFTICTRHEFLVRHSRHNGSAQLKYKEKYATREDAEVAARLACEAAVEACRARLLELKKICKVERPWEKK